MAEWISKVTSIKNFDKLLLAILFLSTAVLCVHLMHKSDAGGDETTFLVWAEATSTTLLGALLGLIRGESNAVAATTTNPTTGDTK